MNSIDVILSSVSRRLRLAAAVRYLGHGLVAGAVTSVVLAVVSAAVGGWAGPWGLLAIPVGGLIAALIGYSTPVSSQRAAALVDHYYLLKDRAATAIDFDQHEQDVIRKMQLEDAASHLRQVRASDCVPVQIDRRYAFASSALATLAIGTLFFAQPDGNNKTVALPLDVAVEQASMLRESMLPELEALRSSDDPEIEKLAEKIEALVEELATETIDESDLMAKLSEMEQSLSEARDAMQAQASEAELKEVAAALQPAEALKAAASAMESGDYESAKDTLEKVDPNQLSDKERRAVADNLKKFVSKLSPGREGKLSNAATQLKEGLEDKDASKCRDGLCNLAKECECQGTKKKIGECLSCQLNRLSQCKSACRGSCEKNGGSGVAKTNSSSSNWGTGKSGEPNDGEASSMATARHEEKLDSTTGEGTSESEFLEAPEGEQAAARSYVAKYNEFKRQAEAVLESEPLPIGHRETVQAYFESIRPSNADEANLE